MVREDRSDTGVQYVDAKTGNSLTSLSGVIAGSTNGWYKPGGIFEGFPIVKVGNGSPVVCREGSVHF